MTGIRIVLLLTASLSLAACATAGPGVDEERFARAPLELPGNGADCVFGSVRDFTVLDDETVLLYTTSRNRAYYVEVTGICPGLRTAFQLGFSDRDGQLCGRGFDAIVIPEGSFTQRCPISRIHKLEGGEVAMVLEYFGRAKVTRKESGSLEPADEEETGEPDKQ